jgi:hypothetical protein
MNDNKEESSMLKIHFKPLVSAVYISIACISGYSSAVMAQNKPSIINSDIDNVMQQLTNITDSNTVQSFTVDTQLKDADVGSNVDIINGANHHQASLMLDEPWSNNYSQLFVASNHYGGGSIYAFNAGKGSIDDSFGWLNNNHNLSVDDKLNLSSEKHPSDMAWIRADKNGVPVDNGILLVSKENEKRVEFYSYYEATSDLIAVDHFLYPDLDHLDLVITFEREIDDEQWIYIVGLNGRANQYSIISGIANRIKRSDLFDSNGHYVAPSNSDWQSMPIYTDEDNSYRWSFGQHATITYLEATDQWWIISMNKDDDGNQDIDIRAHVIDFNGNNAIYINKQEQRHVEANFSCNTCNTYANPDGASNIEVSHKSGQVVVTLGAKFAYLSGFNYKTRMKQYRTNLPSKFRALTNGWDNKCLDVVGANFFDSANVQAYPCNGTIAQKWYYDASTEQLKTQNGYCLDNRADAFIHGRANLWTCMNNNVNQQWYWSGNALISRQSGLALSNNYTESTSSVGSQVDQYPNLYSKQKWYWE